MCVFKNNEQKITLPAPPFKYIMLRVEVRDTMHFDNMHMDTDSKKGVETWTVEVYYQI